MKFLVKLKLATVITLTLILIFGNNTALADSFMPPEPFEIWSEDEKYVFRWDPGPEYLSLGIARAGVYRNDELIYSVEGLPTMGESAASFLFSNDFRHLVFRPSVSQVAAIGFFENGTLLRVYRIDELVRNMEVVTYSVTTASWEDWSGRVFDTDNNTLTIVTRDNITYVFDITTGEIIYDTADDAPFIPHGEDSWGFHANEGQLPLWARAAEDTDEYYINGDILDFEVINGIIVDYEFISGDVLDFDAENKIRIYNEIIIGDILDFEIINENNITMSIETLIGIIVFAFAVNVLIVLIIYYRLKRRFQK